MNDKIDNSNDCKCTYCLKEMLLVVCKFYIICMSIERVFTAQKIKFSVKDFFIFCVVI